MEPMAYISAGMCAFIALYALVIALVILTGK